VAYIHAFELSTRDQTALWCFAAVLLGEIATWAAPRRAVPSHHVLVATAVTGALVLVPVIAIGPGIIT
jgi:hypothetical protein